MKHADTAVVYLFFSDFRERHFQLLRIYHETKTDNIGQHDVKYIVALPIKTVRPVLNVSTFIVTKIISRPIRLATIPLVMSGLDLHNWR
jgi:hypothetical protein